MAVPALPLKHPAALIATWFGAGLLPAAPGTWGSLAALPFAWAMLSFGNARLLFVASVLVFLVGWWAAYRYMRFTDAEDPKEIVVDEVSGQWLALVFADPSVWWHWLLGFALFRLFDILKPWPIDLIDRRTSALAVMADDTVAGAYALVVFALVVFLSPVVAFIRGMFGGT